MSADSEISALLSVAMNASSKSQKAAALSLIEAIRTGGPREEFATVAEAADRKHGAGVGAEVLTLARDFGLG